LTKPGAPAVCRALVNGQHPHQRRIQSPSSRPTWKASGDDRRDASGAVVGEMGGDSLRNGLG
jgi:hypothetical protein